MLKRRRAARVAPPMLRAETQSQIEQINEAPGDVGRGQRPSLCIGGGEAVALALEIV
jgi:hypothetical protein